MKLENLSLEEKIGQMFMVGMPGTEIDDITRELITKHKVGGVILYRKNILSLEHFIGLLNSLRELNKDNKVPLMIGIDQEGGRVNRMPSKINNLVNAKQIANVGGADLCYKSGKVIGEMLKDFNINMDFAPVLDIGGFRDSHPLGNRCLGEKPEIVAKNGIAFMDGIKYNNVIPTIKHFPGHGASRIDSHVFMPTIYKSVKRLSHEDMLPFTEAIKSGADSIMVGHLLVADLNSIYPASLSDRVITGLLRKQLGYKGLIITDDLSMRAITFMFGISHAAIKAISSGADMVMINKEHKKKIRIISNLNKIARRNKNANRRIDESVQRILDIKEKYNIQDKLIESYDIEKINEKIDEINNIAKGNEE